MNAEDIRDRRLREAYASELEVHGDGSTCPSREALMDSALGELDTERNEPVILHLGECTSCAAQWRLAREYQKSATREAADGVGAKSRRSMPRWVPLAAAAVLALVIVGVNLLDFPGAEKTAPIYREPEQNWLVPTIPEGTVLSRDAFVLRWAAGPEGTVYEVNVTSADLEPLVWSRGFDQPEYRIDVEDLADLPSGSTILWRVTARLPGGQRVSSRTFTAIVD